MTKPRPFRFGVNLADIPEGSTLGEEARTFEALGYEVLSCPDHLNHPMSPMDPMVMLAAAAEATTDIQLQPMVLANDARHPALLAKQAATLDNLSGGRFALGMGAGWYGPDFSATGVGFAPAPERISRLEEAIAVIRGLHSGEPFSFRGEHYTVENVTGSPALKRSPLPLLIGGSGPRILGLAARVADTVALNMGLPIGWEKPTTEAPYATMTDQKLQWLGDSAGEKLNDVEIQTSIFAAAITERDPNEVLAPMAAMLNSTPEALAGCPHALCGTQSACIEEIVRWRERWGISYISIPAMMAREFAPVVAQLRGA